MSTDWTQLLADRGLAPDGSHFGDLQAELAAARDGSIVAALTDRGLIRASGPEAAAFLHNLLTNDVNGIDATKARFAGFCTAKGRLLATPLIWRQGDDLLLMLPLDIHAAVLKKLSMYVLRSKVKLSDATADFALVGIASANGAVPPAPSLADATTLPVFGARDLPAGKLIRLDQQRWILALAPAAMAADWPVLTTAACPVGTDAWHWLEIRNGQPTVVAATQEAFIPQMLNMENSAVGGVSFTKGCYPGQEIVARTQYLGKVKRRMYRAQLPLPALPETHSAGVHVFAPETGEQQCGALVSVAPSPGGGVEALVCVQAGAVEGGIVYLGKPDGPRLGFLDLPYAVVD